jgi:putative DNA primase/helicase
MNGAVEEALRRFEGAQREVARLGLLDFEPGVYDQIALALDAEREAEAFYKQELAEYEANKEENPLLKWLSYDSDEALDRIASQQWLIDQIIPVDGFGVIYGPSGSYKSFVAMDMSASIAAAHKWHGNDTDNPGHVVYIGAEGATGLHLRKKAWEIRHGKKLNNLAILGAAVTINNATECQMLVELCEVAAKQLDEPIKLIVVDTLARSFEGEENSASDMGAFVRACDRIRAVTGATVLVVHHSGKDADKGARGSSALRAACDFEFKIVSPGKKVTKLTCTKAKDSDPFDDMTFKLNVVEIGRKDQKGREMGSLTLTMQAAGEVTMVDDLTGHPQTLNNLIANEMSRRGNSFVMKDFLRDSFYHAIGKQDRKAFSRAMDKLVEDEWVVMDASGKIERSEVF